VERGFLKSDETGEDKVEKRKREIGTTNFEFCKGE